jgi:metal-dependent amidase/aminoacylase/carboxypeptidase family protein
VSRLTPVVERALGPDTVTTTHTSMGAEDFALYLTEVPGVLFRLGCNADSTEMKDLHSASFVLDEGALAVGLKVGIDLLLDLTS